MVTTILKSPPVARLSVTITIYTGEGKVEEVKERHREGVEVRVKVWSNME